VSYQVFLKKSAEKECDALPEAIFQRIRKKLLDLASEPRPFGVQKLHGQDAYRIRAGDYRILYRIDDSRKRVEIISVAHRREAYR
jgi:mRNA interferase RelE/StbE